MYPRETCETTGCSAGNGCVEGFCRPLCGSDVCSSDEICTPEGCLGPATPGGELEPGRLGDPCGSRENCPGGVCGSAGYCTAACTTDSDCPQQLSCSRLANGTGECVDGGAPLGSGCADSTQCLGNECLEEPGAPAICTRECGTGLAACPEHWFCDAVDGDSVCRPLPEVQATGGAGCAIAEPLAEPTRPGLYSMIAVAAWATARNLRLRRRRSRDVMERAS